MEVFLDLSALFSFVGLAVGVVGVSTPGDDAGVRFIADFKMGFGPDVGVFGVVVVDVDETGPEEAFFGSSSQRPCLGARCINFISTLPIAPEAIMRIHLGTTIMVL